MARQAKAKGQTNFDPTVFTVIKIAHGTLHLLSPVGNILKRTVTFVKKVVEREITTEPEQEDEAATSGEGAGGKADNDNAEAAAADENELPKEAERRSLRVRQKPARYGCNKLSEE